MTTNQLKALTEGMRRAAEGRPLDEKGLYALMSSPTHECAHCEAQVTDGITLCHECAEKEEKEAERVYRESNEYVADREADRRAERFELERERGWV